VGSNPAERTITVVIEATFAGGLFVACKGASPQGPHRRLDAPLRTIGSIDMPRIHDIWTSIRPNIMLRSLFAA
jgi:hypothetical protein